MGKRGKEVAIVGMSCRFPGAKNYSEFWDNLIQEVHSVSEIPADRWDWRDYIDVPNTRLNKTNIKWGGFIEDVDKFDPLFFKISPIEANYMDPQHRLFLEEAWHAIEDAGYNPKSLAGRKIGVYVGVSKNDYAELMRENKASIISFLSTGTVHSIIANRVSYLLDFTGKSEVVDTACSSFMVALNNAIRDIQLGVCESAIVGGVNVILTPTMYISHSKSGMLSNDGICRSFDENANGYVRGEGVGVVFLKPLNQALQDGDTIWGIVKGIAVGHGGRANNLTAPKVSSQSAVLRAALEDANVDPASIGYIEAHGTGTSLGDPIEIEALKNVYQSVSLDKKTSCGIGSVKTNIGHLESASGVAGLIKILLAFKYKIIPKMLHFNKLNPYIKLEDSPFYILEKKTQWLHTKKNGKNIPLRAGLSSFGMGGVNTHAILEEPPVINQVHDEVLTKAIIPLSAKTKSQLKEYVCTLLDHIKTHDDILMSELSYTLMYGREAMESRVVFIANNLNHLQTILNGYIDSKDIQSVILFDSKDKVASQAEKHGFEEEISKIWVAGGEVDWMSVFSNKRKQKTHLPGYPFNKTRFWIQDEALKNSSNVIQHPYDEKVTINPYGNVFKRNDYFIRDHLVQEEHIVPGVKYLDVFLREIERQTSSKANEIRDVLWLHPIKVLNEVNYHLECKFATAETFDCSLRIDDKVCCTGRTYLGLHKKSNKRLDLNKLRGRCVSQILPGPLYEQFKDHGLNYGKTFKVIQNCLYNENEIICELQQSNLVTLDNMVEPSMADGAFQSVVGLYLLNNPNAIQLLPFSLDSFKLYDKIPQTCLVYARRIKHVNKENIESYDMFICHESGEIVAEFKEFVKRGYMKSNKIQNDSIEQLRYTTKWINRKFGMHGESLSAVLLFDNDKAMIDSAQKSFKNTLTIQVKKGKCFKKVSDRSYVVNPKEMNSFSQLWQNLEKDNIHISGIIYGWNLNVSNKLKNTLGLGVKTILRISQTLILSKITDKIRLLYLYHHDHSINVAIHSMIGGFSRTLAYENPNLILEALGIDVLDKDLLAKITYQELSYYNNAPLYEIRYKNSVRQVKVIIPTIPNEEDQPSLLKRQGVYLITGGCGGLGYIFAKHLASAYQANLLLVGRSEPNSSIRDKLDEIITLGGSAQYVQTDVSNSLLVHKLFSNLKEQKISLNGIMHCAGIIDDAFIIKKTEQSFDSVTSVKVQGTIFLDEVFHEEGLDFFMVFSSIASIMPNQGQSDYAAANNFLDEFIHYRSRLTQENKRSGVSLSINWPLWRNGGIGVIREEEEHLKNIFGMIALENETGIKLFSNALCVKSGKSVDQIIVIEGNKTKIDKHLQPFSYLEQDEVEEQPLLSETLKHYVEQVQEQKIVIDDDESLSNYGMDSSGYVKLSMIMNECLGLDLEPIIFFEFNTIRKLVTHLVQHYGKKITSQLSFNPQATTNYIPGRALVDLNLSDFKGLVFIKEFSQQEFFMRDHIVQGKYNVPGACYIEMAIECGELIHKNSRVYKLTNNYWAKQLSTSGEKIQAKLNLIDKGDYYEYEISSFSNHIPTLHALGQLYINPEEAVSLGKIDLEDIRLRCIIQRNSEEIYRFIHAEGLHVGPSFMPMIDILLNEEEALAHLKLPDFITGTASDYIFHPSLLTGVLQTALLHNKPYGMDETQFIPIAIDEIVFLGNIPVECYVYSLVRNLDHSNKEIVKFDAKVVDKDGNVILCFKGLTLRNLRSTNKTHFTSSGENMAVARKQAIDGYFVTQVENFLKDRLSASIGLPSSEIANDIDLDNYGINSVMIVDLNRVLGDLFGNLSKTLFFEYKNIKNLAQYFLINHYPLCEALVLGIQETSVNSEKIGKEVIREEDHSLFIYESANASEQTFDEAIAIVGMSGRYPEAQSLLEFWKNLKEGKDSISDMPKWRFDFDKYYQETKDDSMLAARWGGFVDDIDTFDPQFFAISPREAALIDPQERLFLEVAWETVENAGYTQESLKGRPIGVFVGALWQSYNALATEQTISGNPQAPSGLLYNIPNRVSYCFDWSGPSLVIDTACSSSLSALHFACESVKGGECEGALVGGVNLSFSASKYLWLAKNNFLSSDGKCKSFGAEGDGYVPGEGVGAIYIKKLSKAIKDKDNILALIKSTSVNHGGKTNGYTVPNPNRQADLIRDSLNKSNISVDRINYIEAHGTGTSLGDPIEISAIKKAFGQIDKNHSCSIGSVKSNIGHLEAAAGIAGLTKIILQMKYKKLVPSLHASNLNPNIDFENTFLKVQRELSSWQRTAAKKGALSPYCAMLASFGAGGSNAHAIVEEYISTERPVFGQEDDTFIIPLSASDPEQIQAYVKKVLYFLETQADEEMSCKGYPDSYTYLRDFAYTFQVARRQMNERLVIVAKNMDELKNKLRHFLEGSNTSVDGLHLGNIKNGNNALKTLSADVQLTQLFDNWVKSRSYSKIAELWITGIKINWALLYPSDGCRRIEVPTYPFKKERFWLKEIALENMQHVSNGQAKLHPLLHVNTSDLFEQRYSSSFDMAHPFFVRLQDSDKIHLPHIVSLELVHEAIYQATSKTKQTWSIRDVIWHSPILISESQKELHTRLIVLNDDGIHINTIGFEQYSISASDENNKLIHVSGNVFFVQDTGDYTLEIKSITHEMNQEIYSKEVCYQALGIIYGNEYKVIQEVQFGRDRALARIALPLSLNTNHSLDAFFMHPSLVESAIQTIMLFIAKQHPIEDHLSLKSLTEICILSESKNSGYCFIEMIEKTNDSDQNEVQYNAYICDDVGNISIKIVGLSFNEPRMLVNKRETSTKNAALNDQIILPSIGLADLSLELSQTKRSLQQLISHQVPSPTNWGEGSHLSEIIHKVENKHRVDLQPPLNISTDVQEEQSAITTPSSSKYELEAFLIESLANALYIELREIEVDKPFVDMGLDSIIGVEWLQVINKKYKIFIHASKIYDYPAITEFSNYLYAEIQANQSKQVLQQVNQTHLIELEDVTSL
ncbi:MAG: SDR family NAD(P)-dependent oxidoreductase [Legionella sp.]|nr:SDR family NAD(P)-dependent oxidoreductase [Legionella sp.]